LRRKSPERRSVNPAKLKLVQRGMGWKRVYDDLRARILSLDLPPGASIDEATIGAMLSVSRTLVREAIIRLTAEGLVVQLPNRGAHVAPLDLARIRDYLEGVDLCQRAATRWAAIRRSSDSIGEMKRCAAEFEKAVKGGDGDRMVLTNRDFHMAIGAACGNVHIADAYGRLLAEGLRIARFTLSGLYYRSEVDHAAFLDSVAREHREMVAAIESRDPDRAEAVASVHTDHTRSRFIDFLNDTLSPSVAVKPVNPPQPK